MDYIPRETTQTLGGPVSPRELRRLRSRIEKIPTEFLLSAGLTNEDISIIMTEGHIGLWGLIQLEEKVQKAEAAYNAWLQSRDNKPQPEADNTSRPEVKDSPSEGKSSGIPTWLIIVAIVVVIFLLWR